MRASLLFRKRRRMPGSAPIRAHWPRSGSPRSLLRGDGILSNPALGATERQLLRLLGAHGFLIILGVLGQRDHEQRGTALTAYHRRPTQEHQPQTIPALPIL